MCDFGQIHFSVPASSCEMEISGVLTSVDGGEEEACRFSAQGIEERTERNCSANGSLDDEWVWRE